MRLGTESIAMQDRKHIDGKEPDITLLELVLRVQGDFRRRLEPIRVTPLQAGVILFLCRHVEANITDTAAALSVRLPTLSAVVNNLGEKRWVTRRYSVKDHRFVCLSLSRRGEVLAQKIDEQVRQVSMRGSRRTRI